jgi:hypothetical protein
MFSPSVSAAHDTAEDNKKAAASVAQTALNIVRAAFNDFTFLTLFFITLY